MKDKYGIEEAINSVYGVVNQHLLSVLISIIETEKLQSNRDGYREAMQDAMEIIAKPKEKK